MHGGLTTSRFGLVSSTSLNAFSLALAELKSQGCPCSSTVDKSRENSAVMPSFSAALAILGGEYTSPTVMLPFFAALFGISRASCTDFLRIFLVQASSKDSMIFLNVSFLHSWPASDMSWRNNCPITFLTELSMREILCRFDSGSVVGC